jgi:CPA1 family monovalent cation:H+ antiporter
MWQQMRQIEQKPYEAVLAYLADTITADNQQAIGIVRRAYDERHRRLSGERDFQETQNELLIEAFQLEYNFIQTQLANKTFSSELGNQLYEQISTDQLVYLQSINTD